MGAYISYWYVKQTKRRMIMFFLFSSLSLFVGPNKIPWHFHHLRQIEGMKKPEILVCVSTCAHLVLPGTSKQLTNNLRSKRMNQHLKANSDVNTRQKR